MASSTKVTLTLVGTPSQHNMWVVDTKESADLIASEGGGALLIGGRDLTGWTAAAGVGNWSEYEHAIRMGHVHLAISPMVANSTKAVNFAKELKKTISGAGAKLVEHKIPAGKTIDKVYGEDGPTGYTLKFVTKEEGFEPAGYNEDEESSEADKLLSIARAEFNFHWSDEDGGFLTLKNGPKFAYIVSGGTPNLKNYLVSKYLELYGSKVPSRSAVSDTMGALEALCDASDSRVRKLSIRAARSTLTGRVWVDLGRRDGVFACINENGWGVDTKADPDVFFKRTDTVKELPMPVSVPAGKVQEVLNTKLRPAFNIKDDEWPMVCAWMVTQIVPNYSAPVAMFLGKSGSGKTTATSVLSTILENVADNGALMPDKGDDIAVTISQEKISIWNNVSKISNSTSDDLCQYIDGATYKKRKLRSNNDVVAMTLEPSILLNGISFEDDLRADLKTRSIVFNMSPMGVPSGSINDIVNALKKDHAEVLGAIYTLVSEVLREAPATTLPDGGSRMADYLKTVLIIDKLWNLDGATYRRYVQSSSEMSYESTDSAVFKVLHSAVVRHENLTEAGNYEKLFTNEELIDLFTDYSGEHGHRVSMELIDLKLNNSRRMTGYVSRHITDWNKFGVTMVDHGNNMVDRVRATRKTFIFDPAQSGEAWGNHLDMETKKREADLARGY